MAFVRPRRSRCEVGALWSTYIFVVQGAGHLFWWGRRFRLPIRSERIPILVFLRRPAAFWSLRMVGWMGSPRDRWGSGILGLGISLAPGGFAGGPACPPNPPIHRTKM